MGRDVPDASLTTPIVPALLAFARGRGASVAELARPFGLGADAAAADAVSVAPSAIESMFEAVAESCGEPWVGLRLAAERPRAAAYGSLVAALDAGLTIADALDAVGRHAQLVHPRLRVEWAVDAEGGRWWQHHDGSARDVGRHVEEYSLAFALTRCRELCVDALVHATHVSLTHPRPRDIAPLQRFFGTTVIFFGEERSGFSVSRGTLAASLDARLAPAASPRDARAESTAAAVARVLPDLLARGATLEAVARSLALSDRTLQRRLEVEGTSFLEVQDSVRERRARDLLREPALTLVDVAERLGFADLATFSRAFKRWTGQPPGMFRRRSIA